MKIKELSDRQILDSIGVSEDEANLLAVYKDAALQYIISHTALTEDEADEKDDLSGICDGDTRCVQYSRYGN